MRVLDLDPILPPRPVPVADVVSPGIRAAPLQLRRDAPFPMPLEAERKATEAALVLSIPDGVGRLPVAATVGAIGLAAVTYALGSVSGPVPFNPGIAATTAAGAYLVMQAVVNRRVFTVDDEGLHVRVGPLPWLRRALHVPEVLELFVERNWTEDGRHAYRFIWELFARTRAAGRVALLENAGDAVMVHWLAEQLANRLNVPWRPASETNEVP
jgi:hypothetical protein